MYKIILSILIFFSLASVSQAQLGQSNIEDLSRPSYTFQNNWDNTNKVLDSIGMSRDINRMTEEGIRMNHGYDPMLYPNPYIYNNNLDQRRLLWDSPRR